MPTGARPAGALHSVRGCSAASRTGRGRRRGGPAPAIEIAGAAASARTSAARPELEASDPEQTSEWNGLSTAWSTAEIRARFLRFFEARSHRRPVGLADRRRPDPAARQRRHGAVQAVLPRRAARRRTPRATSVQKCVRTLDIDEVGKTTRHAHVLPDVRQLLVRRLLQGEARSRSPGSCSPAGRRRRLRASTRSGSGSPSTTTTTRRADSGTTRRRPRRADPAPRHGGQLLVHGRARPRAARARRSSTTAGPSTAPRAARSPTRTATSRSGTSSSCSTSAATAAARTTSTILGELPAKNIDTGMGLERIATILQGVDNLYEIDTTLPVLDKARRADRQDVRRRRTRRRPAAGRRRPRPHRA